MTSASPTEATGPAPETGTARRLEVLLSATAAVAVVDPVHRHVPLCPLHAVTGWQCPLCGGLRAADLVAHGHLALAVRANLLAVAVVPVLLLAWLAGRRVPRPVWLALMVLAGAFTVARNLPGAGWLRPG